MQTSASTIHLPWATSSSVINSNSGGGASSLIPLQPMTCHLSHSLKHFLTRGAAFPLLRASVGGFGVSDTDAVRYRTTSGHSLAVPATHDDTAVTGVLPAGSATSAGSLKPSGSTVADLLLGYKKSLECASSGESGDGVAAAGADVIDFVRAWLSTLHGHPQQGFHHCSGATWHRVECMVEQCLWDLEQDLNRIAQCHEHFPARLDMQLACLRCSEAAVLLRQL